MSELIKPESTIIDGALVKHCPLPNPWSVDAVPADAKIFHKPFGSALLLDDFLERNFTHWRRHLPASAPNKTIVGGRHYWGALCKQCGWGVEAISTSSAVLNITHVDGCPIDDLQWSEGVIPEEPRLRKLDE